MIGRLFEDLLVAVRFGWFYYRAPVNIVSLGFTPSSLTTKQRIKYAWNKAQFK